MEKIVYVTGNYGKYVSTKRHFEDFKMEIDFLKHDFQEPDINDIEAISKQKVMEAYNILVRPCFVIDSGFYIDAYPNNPGYPGAFVKRSGIAKDIDKLLDTMKDITNRKCRFIDCLTFYDGVSFHTFYGINEGYLTYFPRGENTKAIKSNLWKVFMPENALKTLAEMTDEERKNRPDGYVSPIEQFCMWYSNSYLKAKKRVLRQEKEENTISK